MKYILQVNTGSFSRSVFDKDSVLAKLDDCFSSLDISRVIFGWSPDKAINELIVDYLSSHHVEKYFWLPIFGEIHSLNKADRFWGINGEGNGQILNTCEGENFDFVCQSSQRNIRHAISVYEELMADFPVDGAFIDRIRYASAANNISALFGCWCPECVAHYEEAGIDVERLRSLRNYTELFVPEEISGLTYQFKDRDINSLMQVKREIITHAVDIISHYFHEKNLKVGIDTFAPCVADYVGQDISVLGKLVDFTKPMFYLRTYAPAGIPFELNALGEKIHSRIDQLWGGNSMSIPAKELQINALANSGVCVSPGIDSNRIAGICNADDEYVMNSISECKKCGSEEVVLSWDALRISDSIIRKLGAL